MEYLLKNNGSGVSISKEEYNKPSTITCANCKNDIDEMFKEKCFVCSHNNTLSWLDKHIENENKVNGKLTELVRNVKLPECPVCDLPFIDDTCPDCDKLVANLK